MVTDFFSFPPAVKYVRRIREIHPDRIYAFVDQRMPDEVESEPKENETFTRLPEWANEISHEGYPISFKQKVPFGSLQLSFAAEPNEEDLLEADIDLYTDIGHFGEWIRNQVTGLKTDPFTVYVQLFNQRIFPLYVLKS